MKRKTSLHFFRDNRTHRIESQYRLVGTARNINPTPLIVLLILAVVGWVVAALLDAF